MATPQSTTSYQGAEIEDKKLEQITFRFCSECSNMLYPKEDEEAHKLQFTCRTCQYTEDARSTCVFRNILNNSAGETAGVTQDVGSDPTVSSTDAASSSSCCLPVCLHCGIVVACGTCGVATPDMMVTMKRCRVVDPDANDDAMAFASNVGWTEEDLFDEFGDEAAAINWNDAFWADNTDSTSTTSDSTERG
ncbi:hypothetical protein PWT90_03009 [Aphanocladium album]|nr:hypothetical protein PWT90_03009 [Aphanocladium album]